jgi:uncharacterized protein
VRHGGPLRLTAAAARRLHVAAQGLARRPQRAARRADVLAAVRRMGVLQIDTINVVARSQYLVLFSRLGAYDPAWLDELLAAGSLFEYWAHEASLLPIEDYALFRRRMLEPELMGWKYRGDWVAAHRHELDKVLAHLRAHGAVPSADFERPGGGGAPGWWGWKPEKRALEALFTAGEVMVARRQAFQRVYDLRERVHPGWSDAGLPSADETERQLVLRAVRALGVTTAGWVADYYRMNRRAVPGRVRELAAGGELVEVVVDGWDDVAYIHPDHRDLAGRAARGGVRPALTTLLSPFDPLVWDRRRASAIFGFDYRLECYTPAAQRRYGYFVLPLLRRGALVGRADAKAHRRGSEFEVKSLYLEDGVRGADDLLRDVAAALADAAAWHGTPRVAIARTEPRRLRAQLLALLRT